MSISGDEKVLGVLLLRRPKSLGRWDSFAAVLTNYRMIFAQITADMVKEAVEQAKKQAKAEGRGFLGQWSAQLGATFGYVNRYLSMEPSQILSETPGNFSVNNSAIREIKLKLPDQRNLNELDVEIHLQSGRMVFRMDRNADSVRILNQVYGDRVKLPLGYFL